MICKIMLNIASITTQWIATDRNSLVLLFVLNYSNKLYRLQQPLKLGGSFELPYSLGFQNKCLLSYMSI